MPYTTVTSGTTITASWANASVRDQVVTPFASTAARDSAISSPVEGMLCYITDTNRLFCYNGTSWIQISPVAASVATSQTTASTSYTDLATVGPAISLTTGTTALITLACEGSSSTGAQISMAFAVSGATTIAVSDTYRLVSTVDLVAAQSTTRTFQVTGLTAGVNTFTAKYRTTAGTATFLLRDISGVGLLT